MRRNTDQYVAALAAVSIEEFSVPDPDPFAADAMGAAPGFTESWRSARSTVRWFSARNLVGHENAPLTVGGTMSSEALKAMLVSECKGHPDESIYLAVNDLYERLARKGL